MEENLQLRLDNALREIARERGVEVTKLLENFEGIISVDEPYTPKTQEEEREIFARTMVSIK